jgi:hypothetical protein
MADYFTHFSCVLDVGTPHNAARALDLYPACMEQAACAGALSGGFLVSVHPDQSDTKLWMRDATTGDPLQVIMFVQRCAEVFGLRGHWGLQWATSAPNAVSTHSAAAHTCSISPPAGRWHGSTQMAGSTVRSGAAGEYEASHERLRSR